MKIPRLTPGNWVNFSCVVLVIVYVVIVGLSQKPRSEAQVAYIPNSTVAMDQTPCLAATAGAPLPFIANGTTISCGAWPVQVPFAIGTPNVRTMSAGTAIQATDPTKASTFNITLTSTISSSAVGTQSVDAGVYVGGSGVGSSGGQIMCEHKNAQTLGLVIAFSLSQTITNTCEVDLPTGGYVAIRNITGTVTIVTAVDRSMG